MAKTIKMELSLTSIENALRELEAYKNDFERKDKLFRERLAERLQVIAQANYNSAVHGATDVTSPITVSVQSSGGDYTVVVAEGKQVAFVEFGTGVFYNGAAGSSPHPKGTELDMTIGSYGKGRGKRIAWGYRDETGNLVITRGFRASSALYDAVIDVANAADRVAKEVFG